MTNKAQTMLTIALTVAVSSLLVDRTIEPARAQDCAPMWALLDVDSKVNDLKAIADINQKMTRQILVEMIGHRERAE